MSVVSPNRHALPGLDALTGQIAALRDKGDAVRFDLGVRYRIVGRIDSPAR